MREDHKEFLEENRKFKDFLLHDRKNLKIFNDKLEELKVDLREQKVWLEKWIMAKIEKKLNGVDCPEWLSEGTIRSIKEEIAFIEKQIRKFELFRSICLGKEINLNEGKIEKARTVPIQEIMTEQGRRSGINTFFRCPLHQERSPSFVWYREQNTYHCFGCQANGDVIDLYMKMNAVDFKTALEHLSTM